MPLITVDLSSVSPSDKTRIQNSWFELLESETITTANDVDDDAIKTYLEDLVNQRVQEKEERTHRGNFSFTPPGLI